MLTASPARRVFSALFIGIALFLGVRGFFRPATFGQYGHYRGAAIAEIAGLEVVNQGQEACRPCHEQIYALHEKDVHSSVQCEDCHGPGDVHAVFHQTKGARMSKEQAVMPKTYTLEGCLFCHRRLHARPRTFAQIDPAQHYAFLGVTDPGTRCVECHRPHEPLFLAERVGNARIHPLIFECEDCHDAPPARDYREVAHHPVIFACRDCHPAIAEDAGTRAHAALRCTACHLFRQENETAGRVFKIEDARFCLLCHEDKPFKDKAAIARIAYPAHIAAMADVMRRNPEPLLHNPAACLVCHLDHVHDNKLLKRGEDRRQ